MLMEKNKGLSPTENKMLVKLLKIFVGAFVLALILKLLPLDNLEITQFKKLRVAGKEVKAELSVSSKKLAKGLSGRKEMARDTGMLFVFEKEGIHPFWMKDTLIPLDIVFMDSSFTVVDMRKNLQPCNDAVCDKIISTKNFKYALELNSGWTDENNLKIGDKIELVK